RGRNPLAFAASLIRKQAIDGSIPFGIRSGDDLDKDNIRDALVYSHQVVDNAVQQINAKKAFTNARRARDGKVFHATLNGNGRKSLFPQFQRLQQLVVVAADPYLANPDGIEHKLRI